MRREAVRVRGSASYRPARAGGGAASVHARGGAECPLLPQHLPVNKQGARGTLPAPSWLLPRRLISKVRVSLCTLRPGHALAHDTVARRCVGEILHTAQAGAAQSAHTRVHSCMLL
jgi:hypothetical protein